MEFRIKIEEIMEKANLTNDDKNLFVDVLVPYVLSYSALAGYDDKRVIEIISKIEENGQGDELRMLLESKSIHYDDTPTDMINDDLSMVH